MVLGGKCTGRESEADVNADGLDELLSSLDCCEYEEMELARLRLQNAAIS